jgi:hypothetical protein
MARFWQRKGWGNRQRSPPDEESLNPAPTLGDNGLLLLGAVQVREGYYTL